MNWLSWCLLWCLPVWLLPKLSLTEGMEVLSRTILSVMPQVQRLSHAYLGKLLITFMATFIAFLLVHHR